MPIGLIISLLVGLTVTVAALVIVAANRYNKEFKKEVKIEDDKVEKLYLKRVYIYAFLACAGLTGVIILLIELVFRNDWIRNCYSSFNSDTTVSIIVGMMGTFATAALGVITLLYSKSESWYNEQSLQIKKKDSDEYVNAINTKLAESVKAINEELRQKENERKAANHKRETQLMMQVVQEYISSMGGSKAFIIDREVQWCEKSILSSYPAIETYIDRNTNDICLMLFPKVKLPVYYDIKVEKIEIIFDDVQVQKLSLVKDISYDISINSISVYIPSDSTGADKLILFQKRRFDDKYQKCICSLRLSMKDRYSDNDEEIKKLDVFFDLRQCHDNRFEKWSQFFMGDIHIKGE